MPVKRCSKQGKPGFKGGDAPQYKCYTYESNDKQSRDRARRMAEEQLAASKAN